MAEVESGNFVQTGFWDLDTLYVPQDHPAREMQDTYYLRKPVSGKIFNKKVFIVTRKDLVDIVEKVWADGNYSFAFC